MRMELSIQLPIRWVLTMRFVYRRAWWRGGEERGEEWAYKKLVTACQVCVCECVSVDICIWCAMSVKGQLNYIKLCVCVYVCIRPNKFWIHNSFIWPHLELLPSKIYQIVWMKLIPSDTDRDRCKDNTVISYAYRQHIHVTKLLCIGYF